MKELIRCRFIEDTGKAAIAGTIIFAANNQEQKEMKNVFVHHVYFWLKNTGCTEYLGKLAGGIKNLAAAAFLA